MNLDIEKIQFIMKQKKMSKKELSIKSNIQRKIIDELFLNKIHPNLGTAIGISQALNVELHEIIKEEGKLS